MFNNIPKLLLAILISLTFSLSLSAASKNNFNWDAKPKDILEETQSQPYFKNENILGYANQTISGQPCDIWYTFHKAKLWRKVVAFYNNSDAMLETFTTLLSNKYGQTIPEFKGTVWEAKNTLIILKKDSTYLRIIYINKKMLKNPYEEVNKLLTEEEAKKEKKPVETIKDYITPDESEPKA